VNFLINLEVLSLATGIFFSKKQKTQEVAMIKINKMEFNPTELKFKLEIERLRRQRDQYHTLYMNLLNKKKK